MIDAAQAIGVAGMLLVFASFLIRNWVWLYGLNLAGTLLLDVYAVIRRDAVFATLESGIALVLVYRFIREIRGGGSSTRVVVYDKPPKSHS